MPDEEREVFRALEQCAKGKLYLRNLRGEEFEVGEITPVRRGFGKKRGRPDCVAWIELNMNILGARAKAKIPIPIEVEIAGGIGSVKPDYKELFESEGVELPMIVVGGIKRDEKEDYPKTKLKLMITQLPLERINRLSSTI